MNFGVKFGILILVIHTTAHAQGVKGALGRIRKTVETAVPSAAGGASTEVTGDFKADQDNVCLIPNGGANGVGSIVTGTYNASPNCDNYKPCKDLKAPEASTAPNNCGQQLPSEWTEFTSSAQLSNDTGKISIEAVSLEITKRVKCELVQSPGPLCKGKGGLYNGTDDRRGPYGTVSRALPGFSLQETLIPTWVSSIEKQESGVKKATLITLNVKPFAEATKHQFRFGLTQTGDGLARLTFSETQNFVFQARAVAQSPTAQEFEIEAKVKAVGSPSVDKVLFDVSTGALSIVDSAQDELKKVDPYLQTEYLVEVRATQKKSGGTELLPPFLTTVKSSGSTITKVNLKEAGLNLDSDENLDLALSVSARRQGIQINEAISRPTTTSMQLKAFESPAIDTLSFNANTGILTVVDGALEALLRLDNTSETAYFVEVKTKWKKARGDEALQPFFANVPSSGTSISQLNLSERGLALDADKTLELTLSVQAMRRGQKIKGNKKSQPVSIIVKVPKRK